MNKSNQLKVAIAQMASGADKADNVRCAVDLTGRAADEGARVVALPETFDYRGESIDLENVAEPLPGTALTPLQRLAAERELWILAGSVHEHNPKGRPFNTSVLIGPDGDIVAAYRKIHLFDITIDNRSVSESTKYAAGSEVVLAYAAGIRMGLSICYDIRFPELYREMAASGVDLIFIPSSFTRMTGEAHWEVLVRARAIENLSFVVAPGQSGTGAGGIPTHGHSMIVDPWGRVLARASNEENTLLFADLDLETLTEARQQLPALHNRKLPLIR
mgnify:CR=1 FL=1